MLETACELLKQKEPPVRSTRLRRWVLLGELPRDGNAPHERDIGELLGVVNESRQAFRSGGAAGVPGVNADRHHPAEVVSVGAEPVQGRLGGQEEVVEIAG